MTILTWPAAWLSQRSISITIERYESILREIIAGIEKHGDRAKIKNFPMYLERCVRLYFVHNGEALYEERKRMRSAMDLRFLSGMPAKPVAPTPDPMAAIAAAHRVLATGQKQKPCNPDTGQILLWTQ